MNLDDFEIKQFLNFAPLAVDIWLEHILEFETFMSERKQFRKKKHSYVENQRLVVKCLFLECSIAAEIHHRLRVERPSRIWTPVS